MKVKAKKGLEGNISDIEEIKIVSINPYQKESFLVGINPTIPFEKFARFIAKLYQTYFKEETEVQEIDNGEGRSFAVLTTEREVLELILAGATESNYLCIDRSKMCNENEFKDFYDYCRSKI